MNQFDLYKYYVNKDTGVPYKDFIAPAYPAYWIQITRAEYEKIYKEYYK